VDIHGMDSNYSGIGWYIDNYVLEWNEEGGVMCLSMSDSWYDIETKVSEVEDLRVLYRMLSGKEIN